MLLISINFEGYFIGIGAIKRMIPKCRLSNPDRYGYNEFAYTYTKQNKTQSSPNRNMILWEAHKILDVWIL